MKTPRRTNRILTSLTFILVALGASIARADTYVVTLDPKLQLAPATGRVILFFTSDQGWSSSRKDPIEGPFFDNPQPIASAAVEDFKPGDSVSIDGSIFAFPDSLDTIDGEMRVQAILDSDQTQRSHEYGPGNVYSDVVKVELSNDKDETIHLNLSHVIDEPKPRAETENLKWVKFRSELLSDFYGRNVYHIAGVALPPDFNDAQFLDRNWPAIYIIPGFGGREESAEQYSQKFAGDDKTELMPRAVHIVLDPESPLGHHGFVDSPANGPRATAFITELIPSLEERFRLVSKPQARIITGHSSGGWSAIWLQLNHPNVFGSSWASAPDPVDFTAFQMTNLYQDENMYVDEDGNVQPSMRRKRMIFGKSDVRMTAREENLMEHAIDPHGRSGQQWDTWNSLYSPLDESGLPQSMFDPLTGVIDKDIVERWSQFDIARLVTSDWEKYGPIVTERVRIICGSEDSFYLNRAVERFRDKVNSLVDTRQESASGYILIVNGADHWQPQRQNRGRWYREMREYLRNNGLQD